MGVINHDYKDINLLESVVTKKDGTPLRGEIDMYRRILSDCHDNSWTWHFWHDLRLPISVGNQSEIQIDFLLLCPLGMLIIEVKGGAVSVRDGKWYYSGVQETMMERSPFHQASDYMYALLNHRIINPHELFATTVCAFPHTSMSKTHEIDKLDLGYKLWSAIQQNDNTFSFAEFCLDILVEDKKRKHWSNKPLSEKELNAVSKIFANDIYSSYKYSEESLERIANWLNVQSLDVFTALSKNNRIIVEGGPGTGKTTFAKAYIRRYKNLRGVYICWNKLLAAKIKNELGLVNLDNCQVYQYISFINMLDPQRRFVSYDDFQGNPLVLSEKIEALITHVKNKSDFVPFDYIIIDEAQDVFDKNIYTVLDSLCSNTSSGINSGRFLLFFDTEQGYRKEVRQLDSYASSISRYGAHYVLSENKRVPTNKLIVELANQLVDARKSLTVFDLFTQIERYKDDAVKIIRRSGAKDAIKYLREKYNSLNGTQRINEYVLLADSKLRKYDTSSYESLFDRISGMDQICDLTVDNIAFHSNKFLMTSILAYKGLESRHVILLINNRENVDKYELYVGMTRAIYDLEILLID